MAERGSVRLPESDFDRIRTESLKLQLEAGKRISMGKIMVAVFNIALKHRDELIKELRDE